MNGGLRDLLPPHVVPPELVTGASSAPLEVARRIEAQYRMSVGDAIELVMIAAKGE